MTRPWNGLARPALRPGASPRLPVPALLGALLLLLVAPATAQDARGEAELPTVSEKTAGLERRDGLLPLWIDRRGGKVWLEVPAPGAVEGGTVGRYLYVEGLVTGLGSNPVGLDRGQIGETRVVRLEWVGNRLLLVAENLRYRAVSENPQEVRAVEESFADSVLWAGELAALEGAPPGSIAGSTAGSTALVDLTSFIVRDAHGVSGRFRRGHHGDYALDPARSAVDLDACLAFPDNLELEAVLTYATSGEPGQEVAETAAVPEAFSLVQHHSLIRLPEPGYETREFHPRSGSYSVDFTDYAAPLDAPIEKHWVVRHRLEEGEPLVYHVDPGAPEPVRSALVEGASWWAEAFAAAGFEDGFRVEILPDDAHPLDVRYHVIQWVHRATRGWSYGGGVVDPRTGEMVKGHVTLGSLRIRQDRRIFEGLAGTEATGTGTPDDPVELALARIRQLSAHEVGHTLGLAHNFAASTYGRASVMDYPAPLVEVGPDGELDFSRAYDTGVGAWDVQAIRYAYTEAPPGEDEAAVLAEILRESRERGLLFLTDEDARPPGAAHPLANLWDNHGDPVTGLEKALAVRRAALAVFGEGNVAPGEPLARLHEVLVPVYLYHRYQLEAAVKPVGGLLYEYSLRGDPAAEAEPVPAELQRRALEAVLSTLDPEALDLPEEVLRRILPRPPGHPPNRELVRSRTSPAFDALGAAATAAEMAVAGLLQPERAARLVDQHRRDPELPALEEVLEGVVEKAFGGPAQAEPRLAELGRTVQSTVVRALLDLASSGSRAGAGEWPGMGGAGGGATATPEVRARTEAALGELAERLSADPGSGVEAAHRAYLAREIRRYLQREREDASPLPEPAEAPPGSPIGTDWLERGCGFGEAW